jgi:hypothetical protein
MANLTEKERGATDIGMKSVLGNVSSQFSVALSPKDALALLLLLLLPVFVSVGVFVVLTSV